MHRLLADGRLERISHGLYLQAEAQVADLDLVVVAAANDRSTICLTSALVRHGLTDQIPRRIDVALPRGTRLPKVSAPVRWHRFAPATFDLGRHVIMFDGGYTLGLYSPERSKWMRTSCATSRVTSSAGRRSRPSCVSAGRSRRGSWRRRRRSRRPWCGCVGTCRCCYDRRVRGDRPGPLDLWVRGCPNS